MPAADGPEFENILVEIFRKAGWRVRRHPSAGDMQAALIVEDGQQKYVVELKEASEGRRDRLIPLLSQAILQARAFASRLPEPVAPLAVVAARRISPSVVEQLKRFAERYSPDIAVGVIDAEGFRSFVGPGLERLDARPPRRAGDAVATPQRLPDLFSDLNQWMLKILLGQRLPDQLISVPREPIRNASQLAKAANVSVMSASRLLNQLANQGFLDRSGDLIRIVRVDELLERWASANRELSLDIPARWLIKKNDKRFQMFFVGVTQYEAQRKSLEGRTKTALPRCCAGLFAAADALGLGFVQGVPPHLYLERLDSDVLEKRLGLSIEPPTLRPDVYIRIPSNKEAIFDAGVKTEERSPVETILDLKVSRGGIPVADALQVWLDVRAYPARGREQADEVWRVLKPWFEKPR